MSVGQRTPTSSDQKKFDNQPQEQIVILNGEMEIVKTKEATAVIRNATSPFEQKGTEKEVGLIQREKSVAKRMASSPLDKLTIQRDTKKQRDSHTESNYNDERGVNINIESLVRQAVREEIEQFKCEIITTVQTVLEGFMGEIKELVQRSSQLVGQTQIESYASRCKQSESFNQIQLEQLAETAREDDEKRRRSCNLVLYGVEETGEDEDNSGDEECINALLSATETGKTCVQVVRLGKKTENVKRPLLAKLDSPQTQTQVMRNLKMLKNNDKFKGVSINIDLTREERKFIRAQTAVARDKNDALTAEEKSKIKYVVKGNRVDSWKIISIKIKRGKDNEN